ncbi:unnamed protein product, partial [Ectocarpus sp. 12 AP-2014]
VVPSSWFLRKTSRAHAPVKHHKIIPGGQQRATSCCKTACRGEELRALVEGTTPRKRVRCSLGLVQRTANLLTFNSCFRGAEHQFVPCQEPPRLGASVMRGSSKRKN